MLGAICGDILGSTNEFKDKKYSDISHIRLFHESDRITDDTILTCAVADWLLHDIQKNYNDDEALKRALAKRFVYWIKNNEPRDKAYGFRFMQWFYKADLVQEYDPINSFGNGSGMRVSPVGWFFDTLEETLRFAKISAAVTHNHPEGEKGAMCIAAAVFLARKGFDKKYIKDYLVRTFDYKKIMKDVAQIRASWEWDSTCQETVPLAVAAFLESSDFESAVRLAISFGCDSDTVACMAGAIAEAYYNSISNEIIEFCTSRIPDTVLTVLEEFRNNISGVIT